MTIAHKRAILFGNMEMEARKMDEYKQPYLCLWAGISDALASLAKRNYGMAEEILIKAQQAAEEAWISAEETEQKTDG